VDQRFGILLEGRVEVSVEGRHVIVLGEGEVFGELAYLNSQDRKHEGSVVALTAVSFLDVNPAALALATEELQHLMRRELTTLVARRLAAASRDLARQGAPARKGRSQATGFDLQLVDD
jgi:CRP-like cAMP-binding protein